jgi:hypothetical protein
MGRSTFEGPVLAGDNRFGPQRDVGSVLLSQYAFLDFSVTTPGTAGYAGGSGVFVTPNNIPNNIATIWTPQSGSYSTNGPTAQAAPTSDVAGTIYRGVSFLLPAGCYLNSLEVDYIATPTDAATLTPNTIAYYVSNKFVTSATGAVYASVASNSASTVGRTTATFTATQYANSQSTLQDVQNIQPGNQPTWFSQVVITAAMTGNSVGSPTSGKLAFTLRYIQADTNIGNSSTYPYGNFD